MLTAPNPSTWDLLPKLTRDLTVPAPPGAAQLRAAMVRHNVESTYVVPGDWPEADGNEWIAEDVRPSAGSDAQYLIDGPATFQAMGQALETADSAEHFILLLGWSLDPNFAFYEKKTFLQVIEERATRGAAVRVLLFSNTEYTINGLTKKALNELRTDKKLDVTCYLDDRTAGLVEPLTDPVDLKKIPLTPVRYDQPPSVWADDLLPKEYKKYFTKGNITSYGAHHHKILLVYGRDGLIGFCGGVDLDDNRSSYLHDVHLQVTGEAASALLKIAEQRWKYAQDNGETPTALGLPALSKSSPVDPNYLATVLQTVGNPELKRFVSSTLWPGIQRAIQQAKRFIYLEDQYFWSLDLVEELVRAAEHVQHITILVPAPVVGEHTKLRQKAIGHLVRLGGSGIRSKIGIYQMNYGGHEWVHAKLFVFDDEYAIVGSANANNRGYFLDSEAAIGVAERAWERAGGRRKGAWHMMDANFARRLRIQLWHEHLGLDHEELFDGTASQVHWGRLPPTANVGVYGAVNFEPYLAARDSHLQDVASWWGRKKAAEAAKLPFEEKPPKWFEPTDTSVRRPWWVLPDHGWEPGWEGQDMLLDPKS